ncbi:MAG TPA: DUF3307 domain-containing protein [Candidatus Paceibacterota bacterium]|nr:DUF3307 domain-containing protein [Verrucomicrobiota bacterium]HOX04469.1 DUF3307 domain-containing protein [Verrucomicrobiota bacterium]HRZ94173.1 DUF3307 domain-containing protein [Candidatus Paceibacterota bacterium]
MSFDLTLLLALTTAHLLADFVFQSDKDVEGKRRTTVQCKHALVVAALSCVLAGDWRAWSIPVVIGLAHFLVDRAKLALSKNGLVVFAGDQVAHLIVIAAVSWQSPQVYPAHSVWAGTWGVAFDKALLLAAGLILTVRVGGVVVGMLVKPYLDDLTHGQKDEPLIAKGKESQRGLAKGGRVIGELERGLIFFLVMIGKPEAVAFLVAAKSIFRFGELKDRENRVEAEYITIGTMMSFMWGLACAWVTWAVYGKM